MKNKNKKKSEIDLIKGESELGKRLLKIEEACYVLKEENSIYSTDLESALKEFYSQLETDGERKECRKWIERNGF